MNGNRLVVTEGITVQILLFGGADINAALALDGGGGPITVTVPMNQTLHLSGQIGGPSGLTKSGRRHAVSRWHLENTFSGGVTVAGGPLRMDKTLAVPSGVVVDAGTARYAGSTPISGAVSSECEGDARSRRFR